MSKGGSSHHRKTHHPRRWRPRVQVPPRPPVFQIICDDLNRAPASKGGSDRAAKEHSEGDQRSRHEDVPPIVARTESKEAEESHAWDLSGQQKRNQMWAGRLPACGHAFLAMQGPEKL